MPINTRIYSANVTLDNEFVFGEEPADNWQFAIELKVNDLFLDASSCAEIVKVVQKALLANVRCFKNFTIGVEEKQIETKVERESRFIEEAHQFYVDYEERFNTEEHPAKTLREFIIAKEQEKAWYSRITGGKLEALNKKFDQPITKDEMKQEGES